MSNYSKLILGSTMTLALLFGFLEPVWPGAVISFKRLHIFLFNLCVGGVLIIYFTEARETFSKKAIVYLSLTYLYTLSAASGFYIIALLLSILLVFVVESVRIKKFSFFPLEFFNWKVRASEKFHHASLLCLSMSIVVASLVILNNEYFKLIQLPKLTLDVFFLGYSFPISLITMSIMFSFLERSSATSGALKEFFFWMINLGVIIFFLFILFNMAIAEFLIATALFFTVCLLLFHFLRRAPEAQQKNFIVSGMFFLLFTGLTGVLYIVSYFITPIYASHRFYLILHAMVSLYGWNLSGLFIIIRWRDFPIRMNSLFPIM
ncbi:hypothetical protein ACFL27_07155, partial [candidate division CSSED10-310 bacterium]